MNNKKVSGLGFRVSGWMSIERLQVLASGLELESE